MTTGARDTARRALVASLVVLAVVVGALVLWKLRLVVALLFLAFTIAAAMRPGVETLRRRGIPRPIGVALHYVALLGLLALLVWQVVPKATQEIQAAVGSVPTSSAELEAAARTSTGLKQEVLVWVGRQLQELSSIRSLIDPALAVTLRTFEVLLASLFTLACAAYWIFERDRAEALLLATLSPSRRHVIRATWRLIDRKMGAYVRGLGLLVILVGAVLSFVFWLIGLPFYVLLGILAGILEIVPVIGPILAGAIAVAIGLTISWQTALAAGLAVLVVRLLEDYLVIPRVLGDAVGLSPLVVLISISAVAILFGGLVVPLAIPLAASLAVLIEVLMRQAADSRGE